MKPEPMSGDIHYDPSSGQVYMYSADGSRVVIAPRSTSVSWTADAWTANPPIAKIFSHGLDMEEAVREVDYLSHQGITAEAKFDGVTGMWYVKDKNY